MDNPLSLLWGKAQSKEGSIHLLIYHMIDVAACAQRLIIQSFSPQMKSHLYQLVGQPEETALKTLAFLIAVNRYH